MNAPKASDIKRGISVIRENLQCPICLDLLNMPVSTKCDHQFCRFCMIKLLGRSKEANCPVCKAKVTKRSLQESPGFQRLVEGLQHMVQAYEEDTSTDYFTGMPQRLEHLRCQKDGPREMLRNRGKTLSCDSQGVDSADSSRSQGPTETRISVSSVEAQQGYAKLMDLEDSYIAVLENEGFDSGLPEMPQAPEVETNDNCMPCSSVEVTVPLKAKMINTSASAEKDQSCDALHEQRENSEEVPKKMGRRRHRATATMVCADPNKNVDKRCRRSLQKVSEWLLKISPTDVEEESDCSVSDGGSSSSTVKENKDEEHPLTLKRDDQSKSLEEQVFGVIYRRGRKSMGNRTLHSESGGVTALPAEPEPADFDKIHHTDEEEEEAHAVSSSVCNESTVEPVNGQISEDRPVEDINQTELNSDPYRKKMERVKFSEGENVAEDSPVFEVSLRRTTKSATSNVGHPWKEGDNLCLDGNRESKNVKPSKRKSVCNKKSTRLTQMKAAKVAKPLDLVGSEVDKCDRTVRLENGLLNVETEVQIESYPSSQGLGSPPVRTTRQSKRLRAFTEVPGTKKKTRSAVSTKSVVPHLDKADAGEKSAFEERVVRSESPNTKMMENNVMRNGCIIDVELVDFDKIESSFSEAIGVQNEQKESPAKTCISLSAITNAEGSSDVNIQCPALSGVSRASLASQDHSQEDVLEIHSSFENFASKVTQVHWEEEKNDSEQDTEQLLKTFKGSKRRSFQLGIPSAIKSDKQNEGAPEADVVNEEINPHWDLEPSCQMETLKEAMVQQNQETVSFGVHSLSTSRKDEVENSLCSDLIPPSNVSDHSVNNSLPQKKSHILTVENSHEMFEESSCTDAGKGPEVKPTGNSSNRSTPVGRKRKNSETSLRPSVSSHKVDSVLLSPALIASEEEPKELASNINNMTLEEVESQKTFNSTAEASENNGVFKKGVVGSVCPEGGVVQDSAHGSLGFHSMHQEIKLPNSATLSSMTPDDLLPLNVVVSSPTECIGSAGPSEGAQSVEDTSQWSSNPTLRKRKQPQALESSWSENSDEEDQLPSLAQLLGQDQLKQHAEDKTIPPNGDHPLGQTSVEDSVKGAPIVLKVTDGKANPMAPSPEWVPASQGSVDLFDTPEECEGLPDDRGHSFESSQFSNEILATQQKVAMQEELRRLEKMMALVSEALHKKADGSQAQVRASQQHPGTAALRGQDHPLSPPCGDQTRENPTRCKSLTTSAASLVSPPGARTLRSRSGIVWALPASAATVGASPAQDGGGVTAGRRCSRSLRSSGLSGGNAAGVDAGIQDALLQTGAAAPSSESEGRGLPPQACVLSSISSTRATAQRKMVLVASGLMGAELSLVKKFSKKTGACLSAQVTPETTHVIIRTDENLVCERTLKYFLGIAARKWVVSFQWILECVSHGKVLNEAAFEVRGDVVNGQRHQGPLKARTTRDQELLMSGYEVCFLGSFRDMTTDQMEWMAELCGATVVKDPLLFTGKQTSTQLVVLQHDSEESYEDYRALQERAVVVSRGWLLDSVATYTLQNTDEYRL